MKKIDESKFMSFMKKNNFSAVICQRHSNVCGPDHTRSLSSITLR